jgi:hypothetical protein
MDFIQSLFTGGNKKKHGHVPWLVTSIFIFLLYFEHCGIWGERERDEQGNMVDSL